MHLFRDLWTTSPVRTVVIATLIMLGAGGQAAASALAGPVLVRRSIPLFALLTAALIAIVVCDLAIGLLMARLTADWAADIRRRLCGVSFGQDLPRLETTPVGELLDRIDGDVSQVASELRNHGVRIIQALVLGILSIIVALLAWWPAGVTMLILAGTLTAALARPTRQISSLRISEEEAWSDLAAVMEEAIHGQDDVRTSLARPYVLRLFAQRSSQVLKRARGVWTLSARVTAIASGTTRVGIAVIVVVGAWALATGRVDGARMTSVWLLALAFGMTVENIGRMVPELQYALGAWSRVRLLAAARQEPSGGLDPAEGDLSLRGLTFRYGVVADPDERGDSREGRPAALRDVNLTFRRGCSYAIIGRTGSGKSTLAKVLTRAVDVPRGTAYLGETDLLDVDVERLRQWVGIVQQRTEILAGTLAENIALFDPELLEPAASALRELGLTSWVEDLPDGERTRLGEGGYVLSAGQEQLVAFARILVRDPKVVILDEATARMDPVTESRVQRATERMLRGRIGIIIAHRLSSVRRCDEVVVLSDGEVVEAGPLADSRRFARLLATGRGITHASAVSAAPASGNPAAERSRGGGVAVADATAALAALDDPPAAVVTGERELTLAVPPKVEPPALPKPALARTFREILRLGTNDPRFGLSAVGVFLLMVLLALDGSVLARLWAELVDSRGGVVWPAAGICAALIVTLPAPYIAGQWFPEWWVRQMLRISLRLVHGQTGPNRVSAHTPAEVVAQGADTERVVMLADNLIDQGISLFLVLSMTVVSGSFVPALFFTGTMLVSGIAAAAFGPRLERAARNTVAARASFATALVSALSAARTVKLAGATRPVLDHLGRLDRARSDRQRHEISIHVWAKSTPAIASGLLPIGAWAMYLFGDLPAGATLVAVATLGAARWFAWTTASLVSQLPSARVWTRRTVSMTGVGAYSDAVPGVDLSAGTAPAPPTAPRHPLRRLDLVRFSAVHEDGTLGVHDLDLTIERGQLVLVVGPVGSGKSSLLRALAGIVHHTGGLRWNGELVTKPEVFLRPNQVGYVAQLPRVLSGTIADNIRLGHEVDAVSAVSTAQLERDLAAAGGGLGLMIGHKGTRLSGGQLQRLALARALAPRTELLVADDVSSALDVNTELALWRALREHGVTVVGSTSKWAALNQADVVVVLVAGRAVATGPWSELADQWGHLAG